MTVQSLADLAEDQWGLFTRRQAEATGMAWTTLARLGRDGAVERIAHGVYRMRGTPAEDHLEVRAAWLQLAPDTTVWERTPEQGVVSRRSAAAIYGFGHLPADIHQFTLPVRRQTRRADVRLYMADLADDEWTRMGGLLVTRPSRTVADLLGDREDPEAVAQVVADALRGIKDYPSNVAKALEPHAAKFGLAKGSGLAVLEWLLDLTNDPQAAFWVTEARDAFGREGQVAESGRSDA
jgi:Transcriptional regulator, AbiEi antitoxin